MVADPAVSAGCPHDMKLERTVAEVAALVGGRVEGEGQVRLASLAGPGEAGPDDLAPFFGTPAASALLACRAGALLLGARVTLPAPPSGGTGVEAGVSSLHARSIIRVDDADLALDRLVLALVPGDSPPPPGVHPTAVVGPDVELGADVSVGPHVVLGRGARVGARTRLLAGACLGEHARIGADGVLHEHVVIGSRCVLGDRVIVHVGAVIGSDGFGFRQDKQGRHTRIPQKGLVLIGDDVEIGANTTIDRARFTATRIGNGCKLDDLVHIAHNVELGEHCAFAAQVGVAGSTVFGAHVLVGGHSGFANGLLVGARANIGGFTGVTRDVEPGSVMFGFPAAPHRVWARDLLNVRRLGELAARVKALETALAAGRDGPAPEQRTSEGSAPSGDEHAP